MKICDLCNKPCDCLHAGPEDNQPPREICDPCRKDLLQRIAVMERQAEQIRRQMRAEMLAAWKRDRAEHEI